MKVNQKVKYGVACLYELSKNPTEFLESDGIAHRQNIPPAYAHKILQSMAHVGLVQGVKGLGYRISKPLSDITVLHVIDALSKEEVVTETPDFGALIEARINNALRSMTLNELQLTK